MILKGWYASFGLLNSDFGSLRTKFGIINKLTYAQTIICRKASLQKSYQNERRGKDNLQEIDKGEQNVTLESS